ncbi:hypothetical protein LCO01nite_10450 [Lapidilactobacillus concavus]|nr:hypothetical protein LCO01nite_10450 [Lapidilactobacillus concavus]
MCLPSILAYIYSKKFFEKMEIRTAYFAVYLQKMTDDGRQISVFCHKKIEGIAGLQIK